MKEYKFKELFTSYGGTSLESEVIENGNYNFISIGNYTTDGLYYDNFQRVTLNDKTKEKLLNKNDLVMILNDKTSSGDIIGATILIDEDNKYIYNQRSERLICNNLIIPKYAWCYLNSISFRKQVFTISQGGTQIYVNFPSVENLNVYLPESIEKQKYISDIVFLVNKKYNNELLKLNKLQELKKGLMQSMFV